MDLSEQELAEVEAKISGTAGPVLPPEFIPATGFDIQKEVRSI